MEALPLLKNLRLFQGLDQDLLSRLADKAVLRRCTPGEMIFDQGVRAEAFYVLVQGAVKLFRSTSEGREQTLYLVEEGEPFCLCTIFYKDTTPVNAQSMMDSLVVSVPGQLVEQEARKEPQLLFNILDVLNNRLMRSMQMIEDLALRDIQQRTASFLVRLNDEHPDEDRVTLTVPRQEVAKILGTTPETISRVLARMAQDGIIEAKGRLIDILDPRALEHMAG